MNKAGQKLREIVQQFSQARILVIGDVIIDHFLWGAVSRISPEAPVPVVNVQREDLRLGGAANVLRNIVSLGGKGTLCGLIGDDAMGAKSRELVRALGADDAGLIVDQRPTTIKSRVIAQGQQIVRFDREQTGQPQPAALTKIQSYLESNLHNYDAVMVSDYAKGVVNEQVMICLRQLLLDIRTRESRPLPLVVDPKPVNFHCFVGATVITPNHHEATQMAGMPIGDELSLLAAGRQIQDDLGSEAVLITRGEAGMALVQKDCELISIPTMAKEVYDVTGAGDTVAATMALGLAVGCRMDEAAVLANYAAGIVVGKVGTACVATEELLHPLSTADVSSGS